MRQVRGRRAQPAAPRYLRPEGNARLRRRRRTRAAAKIFFWAFVWIAGAGALVGLAAGGWRFLTDAGRFPLSLVIVEGAPDAVKTEVVETLEPFHGRNLLDLDLREMEHRIMAHPWVSSVSVHRRLPDALLVILSARSVEALVEVGGEIRMVGGNGRDLGRYEPRWGAEDQPIITGLSGPGAVTRADVAGRLDAGLKAMRALRSRSPSFVERISTVDVSREDRLTVTLRDFGPPLYLNPDTPSRNIDRLEAVRAGLAREGLEAGYLDLRFKDRVVVMPTGPVPLGGAAGAS